MSDDHDGIDTKVVWLEIYVKELQDAIRELRSRLAALEARTGTPAEDETE